MKKAKRKKTKIAVQSNRFTERQRRAKQIAEQIKKLAGKRKKQLKNKLEITEKPATGRFSLKDFPLKQGIKIFSDGFWTANIKFLGMTLLVEPTPLKRKDKKILVRTVEGKEIIVKNKKTEKEILEIITQIYHQEKAKRKVTIETKTI
jgi:hypothetical protein